MPRKPKNAEVAAASLVETEPKGAVVPPPAPVKKAKSVKAKPAPDAGAVIAKQPRTTRAKKLPTQPATPAEVVSTEPTMEQVAHEAYLLWLGEGQPQGKDMEHWLVAEQIVRSRLSLLAAAVHTA
jgi:hypothetical protein